MFAQGMHLRLPGGGGGAGGVGGPARGGGPDLSPVGGEAPPTAGLLFDAEGSPRYVVWVLLLVAIILGVVVVARLAKIASSGGEYDVWGATEAEVEVSDG